jgi:hypothetical protein
MGFEAKPYDAEFAKKAVASATENVPFLTLTITKPDGTVVGTFKADLRTFSTGSTGYNVSEKAELCADVRVQASCNFTIIGTKPK